jgi:hypothetical protein
MPTSIGPGRELLKPIPHSAEDDFEFAQPGVPRELVFNNLLSFAIQLHPQPAVFTVRIGDHVVDSIWRGNCSGQAGRKGAPDQIGSLRVAF